MKLIIGLMNDEGRAETKEISSALLLMTLATLTHIKQKEGQPEDGAVFVEMSATDPEVVRPEDYEEACIQLGMLNSMILHAL